MHNDRSGSLNYKCSNPPKEGSHDFLSRRTVLSLSIGTAAMALMPTAFAEPEPSSELIGLTLHKASQLIRRKDISPVELTKACLARIDKYDDKINAFITVTRDLALAQAEAAEKEIIAGNWRGSLHGIPLALKDNIDTAGIRTTAASAVFASRVPEEDAEVVRRLKRAGSVLLGKLNMHEFGAGEGVVGFWGPAHNPWALDYMTGGSSSGSGAALAAEFCFGSLGTDTGGSVRMPAAHCGVVGLKPTNGLVSTRGVIPLIESFDCVGLMGKTVLDVAHLLQAIAGYDPNWSGSVKVDLPNYAASLNKELPRPRLGIPRAHFFDHLDPEVADIFATALITLRSLVSSVTDNVSLPIVSSQLRALSAETAAFHRELIKERIDLYQPLTKKGFSRLRDTTIDGADYVLAKKKLEGIRRSMPVLFQGDFDLLVMPTWKVPPLQIKDRLKQLEDTQDAGPTLYNTSPINPLGLPAISVPCGFTKAGLPVGLQIVGAPFGEAQVLALAHAYEQATKWHLRKAKLGG